MKQNRLLICAALLLCVALLFAAGCTGGGTPDATEPVKITVFAAASLTGAMTEIGKQFEEANKDIIVEFNFAGSQALKTQIQEGADADMFISANNNQFNPIHDAGMIAEKKTLLKNKLAIAVPVANPAGISDLGGLAQDGVVLVIGNKDVPFGQYTRDIISKYQNDSHAGYIDAFMANVVSEVDAVDKIKPVLILGEADASLVYKSDISKDDRKDITLIEIPDEYNVIADYPYGILKATGHPDEIKRFEAFLTGPAGSAFLTGYGFDPVSA
jgi:molybdate transport system substrate-binding protein